MCVWKIQYEGVCREANTARGEAECCISLETPPEYCMFHTHKQGGVLTVILYFLVIWLRAIFSSTQTAAIFDDQDISKCSYNLFLVVEQAKRLVWLVLEIYNITYVINRAVLVESCFKSFVIRRSVCVYTIYSQP